jgi:phage terminase large subunit GpA-like protein
MNDDRLFSIPIIHIKKRETVSSWAMKNHYLKRTASYFNFKKHPFMKDPTDAMGDIANTWGVVISCPAQTGKTSAILNFIGWMAAYDRANTMLILDTSTQAINLSKNRLKPFIRDICGVHNDQLEFNNPDKSNSSVNISLGTGANLILGSAKSASTLCSTPSKYVILDEVDRYVEIPHEGDPLALAHQRQLSYRGMTIYTSTPTTAEDSRIWKQFQLGTMEVWSVRCPTCSNPFSLTWKDIDWSEPERPVCHCPSCGEVWTEADIILMDHLYVQQNETPQTDKYGRILRSFSINGLLCHNQYTWQSLREYERSAMQVGESAMQSFRNTRLGECYTPPNEIHIEASDLFRDCSEKYKDDCIPDDIDFITCGVDTHDNGLYAIVMGWSSDLSRAYGLTYHFLPGDPNDGQVWAEFDALVSRKFVRTDGVTLMPAFTFADCGGHRANAIFLQTLRTPRLKPCKGYASSGSGNLVDPLIRRLFQMNFTNGVKGKCEIVEVGANSAKDTILQMEKFTLAGDKRLIFPRKKCFDLNFFRGLTSEVRVGSKWIAPKSGHTLNEPLDCLVYALACASYYKDRYYDTRRDKEAVYRDDKTLERNMSSEEIMKDEAVPVKYTKKKKSSAKKKKEHEVSDAPKAEKVEKAVEKVVDSQKVGKAPEAPEAPKKKFKHL